MCSVKISIDHRSQINGVENANIFTVIKNGSVILTNQYTCPDGALGFKDTCLHIKLFWSEWGTCNSERALPQHTSSFAPYEVYRHLVEIFKHKGFCNFIIGDMNEHLKVTHPVCDFNTSATVTLTGTEPARVICGEGQYQTLDRHCVSLISVNDGRNRLS